MKQRKQRLNQFFVINLLNLLVRGVDDEITTKNKLSKLMSNIHNFLKKKKLPADQDAIRQPSINIIPDESILSQSKEKDMIIKNVSSYLSKKFGNRLNTSNVMNEFRSKSNRSISLLDISNNDNFNNATSMRTIIKVSSKVTSRKMGVLKR